MLAPEFFKIPVLHRNPELKKLLVKLCGAL